MKSILERPNTIQERLLAAAPPCNPLPGVDPADLYISIVVDSSRADESNALFASYYDDIYTNNHTEEVRTIQSALLPHLGRASLEGLTLLDVGCGTGHALNEFAGLGCRVVGVDVNPHMLEVARANYPDLHLEEGDMRTLESAGRYDIISCLFDPLSYAKNQKELNQTVGQMANCLKPGGLQAIQLRSTGRDSSFTRQQWACGDRSYEITKESRSQNIDIGDRPMEILQHGLRVRHFREAAPDVQYTFWQERRLSLFERDQYLLAAANAGLTVVAHLQRQPPLRRELLVFQKPNAMAINA